MSAHHTPGPWQMHKDPSRQIGWNVTVPHPSGLGHLANVYDEANARLIAASPDMLAALRRVVLHAEQGRLIPEHASAQLLEISDAARAAIAKAEGRE